MCLGVPGCIVEIVDEANAVGLVEICGVRRRVNLSCIVEEGKPVRESLGAWVLVHVGFAMSRIDETEARRTLELLESLGELMPELAAMKLQ